MIIYPPTGIPLITQLLKEPIKTTTISIDIRDTRLRLFLSNLITIRECNNNKEVRQIKEKGSITSHPLCETSGDTSQVP